MKQTKGCGFFFLHEKEKDKNVIICSSSSFECFDIPIFKNSLTQKIINKKVKRRKTTKILLNFHENIFF
jgi:hypothetical protein